MLFSLLIILAALAVVASQAEACSYTLPISTPDDASLEIDPSWLGYHYETSSWQRWAEDNDGNPNEFSRNMYKAVSDRTGGPPHIRLGGTTGEYALFDPNQQSAVNIPITRVTQGSVLNKTIIGPAYWELCKNFDDLGAMYTIQVPVGWNNISETLLWATTSWNALNGTQRILAIEVGNEPNTWPDGGFEPPEYVGAVNDTSYSQIFLNHSAPINAALGFPDGYRIYEAFDTAFTARGTNSIGTALPVPEAFSDDHIDQRGQIKQVGHHYYGVTSSLVSPTTIEQTLFNHSIVVENMAPVVPWIQFLNIAANGSRIPFLWTEIANSLGPVPGYQNVLGSALWNLDVFLYSMSIGVNGIAYSENFLAFFLTWLPVESDGVPAQTFADWYAVPFVADFIGNTSQSHAAVLEQDPSTSNPNIIAYAAYEDDEPKRVAIVDFDFWGNYKYNGSVGRPGGGSVNLTEALPGNGTRPVTSVTINVPSWCTQAKANWLMGDLGVYALAPDITYGGSQWTVESMGQEVMGVSNGTEMIQADNGQIVIQMPGTSAALLWLME